MRSASVSLVKDEADIIEGFVRHNLHFVDRMYVIDDRSSDNTPEILRRLASETSAVRLLECDFKGPFHQARRTTAALHRIASEEDWDVVLALDADELICAADRAALEAEIAEVPPGSVGGLSEIAYFATAADDMSIVDPLIRVMRANIDRSKLPKSFATRPFLSEPTLGFSEGNHELHTGGMALPTHILPNAALAHFAVRSADQVAIKCLKHYIGWRSRSDYQETFSSHLINGARALKVEPSFALDPGSAVIAAYLGFDRTTGFDRPFVERRGQLKWPELSVVTPYVQLLGLLDPLIGEARINDEARTKGGSS